jgi:hypothetical protein
VNTIWMDEPPFRIASSQQMDGKSECIGKRLFFETSHVEKNDIHAALTCPWMNKWDK